MCMNSIPFAKMCPKIREIIVFSVAEAAVLWELDRATFNNIVMEGLTLGRTKKYIIWKMIPTKQTETGRLELFVSDAYLCV